MNTADIPKLALQWSSTLSIVIAGVSTVLAITAYRKNVRTKEAEFISQLHSAFFVDKTYKEIREILDNEGPATAKVDRLIKQESGKFTDFLNFFELAAYFESCDTLSLKAVEAMLGYYLNLLDANRPLREYIQNPQKGFEYLSQLLNKRRKTRGKE